MSKHTKGPWKVHTDVKGLATEFGVHSANGGYRYVALTDKEEDARLIAAAPELLEEVKTLIHILEKGTETPEDLEGAIDWAKALVVKAEGSS